MKPPYLICPITDKPDAMWTLTCITMTACIVKFLLEGVELHIGEHILNFGHADSLTYGAILTPVLGSRVAKEWKTAQPKKGAIDNPDA